MTRHGLSRVPGRGRLLNIPRDYRANEYVPLTRPAELILALVAEIPTTCPCVWVVREQAGRVYAELKSVHTACWFHAGLERIPSGY